MVSGLRLTSSDETIRSEFAVGAPALFHHERAGQHRAEDRPGARRVARRACWGCTPSRLSVMPNEMAPPATPM